MHIDTTPKRLQVKKKKVCKVKVSIPQKGSITKKGSVRTRCGA
jgi:hypothetical protein